MVGILYEPHDFFARWLTWEEVIKLLPGTEKWIQYGRRELVYDSIRYDAENDDILQDYEMSIYTKASKSYRRCWVIWDSFPSEKQVKDKEWMIDG